MGLPRQGPERLEGRALAWMDTGGFSPLAGPTARGPSPCLEQLFSLRQLWGCLQWQRGEGRVAWGLQEGGKEGRSKCTEQTACGHRFL